MSEVILKKYFAVIKKMKICSHSKGLSNTLTIERPLITQQRPSGYSFPNRNARSDLILSTNIYTLVVPDDALSQANLLFKWFPSFHMGDGFKVRSQFKIISDTKKKRNSKVNYFKHKIVIAFQKICRAALFWKHALLIRIWPLDSYVPTHYHQLNVTVLRV